VQEEEAFEATSKLLKDVGKANVTESGYISATDLHAAMRTLNLLGMKASSLCTMDSVIQPSVQTGILVARGHTFD
jgi:hypothetical protein